MKKVYIGKRISVYFDFDKEHDRFNAMREFDIKDKKEAYEFASQHEGAEMHEVKWYKYI